MSQQAAHIQTCLAQEQARTARKEAKESARSAENSYVIAIMGMFFLPASTLATIFAMPIFKWDEHPLDLLWRSSANATETPEAAAADSSTATSTDSSSPADVLTGYVWIYCIISIGVTMLLYIYKLIREKIGTNRLNGSEHPVLDLLLKPLTMIWKNKPQQSVKSTDPDRKRWTGNALPQAANPAASPRFSLPQHMPSPGRHPTTQSLPAVMANGQPKGPFSSGSAAQGHGGTVAMAPPGSAPPRRQTEPLSTNTEMHRYGRDYAQTPATHVNSSSSQGNDTWVQGASISQTPHMASRTSSTTNLVQQSTNVAQHPSNQRATPSAPSHQDAIHTHSQRSNSAPGPPLPPPPATQPHRGRQGSQTSQAATANTQPPRIVQPPRNTQPKNHGTPPPHFERQTPSPAPMRGQTFDQKPAEPKQQPSSRVHTVPVQAPMTQVSNPRGQHGRYWVHLATDAHPPARDAMPTAPDNIHHAANRSGMLNIPPHAEQHRFAPEDPDSLWPGPPVPGSIGGWSSSGGSRDSSRVRGAYDVRESESRERLVGAAGPPGMADGSSNGNSSRSGMLGMGGR